MNLVQELINGLILGHAYARIAIGWTVLRGVARLVNVGHGQMYMSGAFVAWWATAPLGVPYPVAILVAVGAGLLLGLLVQAAMLRLTLEQNLVSIMIVTLGFGHVLRGAAALAFGATPQILETPLSLVEFEVAGAWVTAQDGLIVAAAIEVVDRLVLLERGRVLAEGPVATMRDDPRIIAAYLGEAVA